MEKERKEKKRKKIKVAVRKGFDGDPVRRKGQAKERMEEQV